MSDLYTMERIIEECEKHKPGAVSGNIVFPSDPSKRIIPEDLLIKTENVALNKRLNYRMAVWGYALEIGLIDPESVYNQYGEIEGKNLKLSIPKMAPIGECFLGFTEFERFKEVIQLFKTISQAYPFLLMCDPPEGGFSTVYRAKNKEDFLNYVYEKF